MNIEDLWDQFHQPLKTYISQRVNDQSIVDDLLQIVFMKIQVHLPNLIDEQKIDSWIYRITRNTIIDFYRTKKTSEILPDDLHFNNRAEEENFTKEATVCIRSTIKRLPEKYREALELTEFQGLSQKELSEKLGISYSGAKSRVQRGRGKLKQLLEGCCNIEADRYGNIVDFRILKE
ncbi:RNA polymerase sigma factor SigZ [Bacillus subtilis]|uniref:RNA polymerase sigma factor SigZ n=1 Tax=Bacillus TaxID=1386 RepID=UPI000499BC35|nr:MULTISPECIES: RNA polymerase sigma factor SigZ [Bacillus]AOL30446.1 RNA polymerase sigma factor SigZ [Alkalicoccobacillus gibsonii]AIC99006.1 RNA polymerase sigma70 [Bacillus subtilis subsp. subtilis str. OH 131.1]AOA55435.1 RNA polymerase sigma factor SigZ [Bacillus subtilis]AOL26620.1 RNA polymerase sigma factor SigZ [Bacillus sp. FJAT-14266]AXP49187.1 RNA polymerase sigma factor SigZ [Bacillus subtilis subsp. subtilis]